MSFLDFIEPITHGKFRGDLGDGESGGLGRERQLARRWVPHLDDHHAPGFGIDGELHLEPRYRLEFVEVRRARVAHHLVFAIGKRPCAGRP